MKRVFTAMLMVSSLCPARVKGLSQLRKVASPNSLRRRPLTWAHWPASVPSTPGNFGLSSTMARSLFLRPGQARGLPATNLSAMTLAVEVAFKSFGDVVAFPVTLLGHRRRRGAAAPTAAAEEQDRRVVIGNLLGDRRHEIRVDIHCRKILPGLQHGALAERTQIGKSDERPFGTSAHVDELRLLVFGEELPGIGRFQIARIGHDRLDPRTPTLDGCSIASGSAREAWRPP